MTQVLKIYVISFLFNRFYSNLENKKGIDFHLFLNALKKSLLKK